MISSSIIEIVSFTLFLTHCLECSGRSIPGSSISVTAEFSDIFKTFLLSYFENRAIGDFINIVFFDSVHICCIKKVIVITTFVLSIILHYLCGWDFSMLNALSVRY